MGPKKPHFSLGDVKSTAEQTDGLFLTRTRAEPSFPTARHALTAARAMIAGLTERDFVETKHQNPDVCDVYALVIDTGGWYVKLTLLPEQVVLISFYPLEHPIRTAPATR